MGLVLEGGVEVVVVAIDLPNPIPYSPPYSFF